MFLPPTIDLANSEKYILSIRIKPDGFMFSLKETNGGKNYCLRQTTFDQDESSLLDNIKKIIFDLNFLTLQYAKTNVILVLQDYIVVPEEFYDSKLRQVLYDFTAKADKNFVLTDEHPKYKQKTLYAIDEAIYEFLSRSLFNPHFYHHTSPLINLFEGRAKTTSLHSKMYVNLHEDIVDILCFSGDKFVLGQSYERLTTSEQIYYILKIWESLKLDQLRDQLLIAGQLDDHVSDTLRDYIKNIERIATPSEVYLWNEEAQKAPLDLIALSL